MTQKAEVKKKAEVWNKHITIFLKYIASSVLEDILHNSLVVSNSLSQTFANEAFIPSHAIICLQLYLALSAYINAMFPVKNIIAYAYAWLRNLWSLCY